MTMLNFDVLEGDAVDADEYYTELQKAINMGTWSFQGSHGRAMMDAIVAGRCMLGREQFKDYWGNRIPSRDQVKEGTQGSFTYVSNRFGEEWADLMEGVE